MHLQLQYLTVGKAWCLGSKDLHSVYIFGQLKHMLLRNLYCEQTATFGENGFKKIGDRK